MIDVRNEFSFRFLRNCLLVCDVLTVECCEV